MFWARNKSLFWPSLLKTVHSPHFSRRGRLVASLRYRRPYWFQMYRVYSLEDEYHPQGTCTNGCAVVRVLASHQCGPGSDPGVNAIRM